MYPFFKNRKNILCNRNNLVILLFQKKLYKQPKRGQASNASIFILKPRQKRRLFKPCDNVSSVNVIMIQNTQTRHIWVSVEECYTGGME